MRALAFALLVLALSGCTSFPALVDALAKDPATACITVQTIYGTAKIYRTALPNGTVRCDADGLAVTSGTAPRP